MAKRRLADAPEGGETFEHSNPNFVGGEPVFPPLDEDYIARLRRLRAEGKEPPARLHLAQPDGTVKIVEAP
jgi:hypothetical protein